MLSRSIGLLMGAGFMAMGLFTGCDAGQIGDEAAEAEVLPLPSQTQAATSQDVAINKELFVTDLSVVADPKYVTYKTGATDVAEAGGWSFGRLFENLMPSGKSSTLLQRSQFILNWLALWEQDQVINGLTVPARPAIRALVIDPWKLASGCTGSDSTCQLDLKKAPFRLEAIVYRPDLRRIPGAGQTGHAGEGRFVFTVLGANGAALPFTVIFEYIIPITRLEDIAAISQEYHKLGSMGFGAGFNEKLFKLTTNFMRWNVTTGRPNGSALGQIRTNEVALDPVWELREFVLTTGGDRLVQDTVKNEPAALHNDSVLLTAYAAAHETSILEGNISMPAMYQGLPWLAGSALVPFGWQWKITGVSETVRKSVALSTCSGCHLSETSTPFVHVMAPDVRAFLRKEQPPAVRGPAALSNFLKQELQGARLSDYQQLLLSDSKKVRNGPGRDHQ